MTLSDLSFVVFLDPYQGNDGICLLSKYVVFVVLSIVTLPSLSPYFNQAFEIWSSVCASSPLVSFGELNDNTVKGLTSLLSVSKFQQESKLDGISYNVQMKTKVVYCYKLKLD